MNATSSIGPGWPPSPTSSARIKGIDTRGVIATRGHLERLLEDLERLTRSLDAEACDRLSLRAVMRQSLIDAEVESLKPWVEAVMPIEDGTDNAVVYFGRNGDSRPSVAADVERALKHVGLARRRRPKRVADILQRPRRAGYRLRILDRREREGDVDVHGAVAELYRRFGWSFEETGEILANPSSLIGVAAVDLAGGGEKIVCAGIAELSHLRLEDGVELRIAEFTEAATLVAHQGQGLYSAVAGILMVELARLSRRGELLGGELDLGFGECSGHDVGVLIAARRLGRRFALEVLQERGWPFPGYLPQHVPIAGAPRATRYNDLFPTFIPRSDLYRFAGP